jgi:hypothetical protein
VQCERARLDRLDVRQIGLQVREHRLLDAHQARWLAELPTVEGVRWTGFWRGFAASAELEAFELLEQHALRQLPLFEVSVPWPERASEAASIPTLRRVHLRRALRAAEQERWLAEAPLLSTLEHLAVRDGFSECADTRRLLASPHLGGLRSLALERCRLGTQAVLALVEGSLPRLEGLVLSERGSDQTSWSDWTEGLVAPGAMQALADWDGLARLRWLDLSGNRVEGQDLATLFSSPHLTGLRALGLEYVFASCAEIPWNAAPAALRLETLRLGGRGHEPEDVEALCDARCLAGLRELELQGAVFEDEGSFGALLRAPFARTLEVLGLGGVENGAEELVPALVEASLPRLHTLDLVDVFGLGSLRPLTTWPAVRSLHRLRLTALPEADLEDLLHGPLEALEWLELTPERRQPDQDLQPLLTAIAGSPLGQRLASAGGLMETSGRWWTDFGLPLPVRVAKV